jgi:aminoglycoside phosphotransferase (APT) family kinase protein
MEQSPDDIATDVLETLAAALFPGARVRGQHPMTGGSSAAMTAIDVDCGIGAEETVILRQCGGANLAANPHAARTEFQLLRALHDRGLPVPRALHVDESLNLIDAPFLVISHLDGQPDYGPEAPLDAARQMAVFLAGLHNIDVSSDDLAFVERPADGPGYLETERGALPEVFLKAHDMLEAAWPPANPNGPCLLHGDLWPGNMLWQDGRLTAVVDWEDATVGDPMADLAIARVDMSWSYGFESLDVFTTTYGELTGFDLSTLPFWDLRASLRQVPHAPDYAEGWQELGRLDVTQDIIGKCHQRLAEEALAAL